MSVTTPLKMALAAAVFALPTLGSAEESEPDNSIFRATNPAGALFVANHAYANGDYPTAVINYGSFLASGNITDNVIPRFTSAALRAGVADLISEPFKGYLKVTGEQNGGEYAQAAAYAYAQNLYQQGIIGEATEIMQFSSDTFGANYQYDMFLAGLYSEQNDTANGIAATLSAESALEGDIMTMQRAQALYYRSVMQNMSGDWESALGTLDMIVERQSEIDFPIGNNALMSFVLNAKGYIMFSQQGDIDGALPILREAVNILPENANALHSLGEVLYANGEHQEASALLQRSIGVGVAQPNRTHQVNAYSYEIMEDVGDATYCAGDHQGARGYWMQASDLATRLIEEEDAARLQLKTTEFSPADCPAQRGPQSGLKR